MEALSLTLISPKEISPKLIWFASCIAVLELVSRLLSAANVDPSPKRPTALKV